MANTLYNLHKRNLSRDVRRVITCPVDVYQAEKKRPITVLRTDPNNQLDVKRRDYGSLTKNYYNHNLSLFSVQRFF